jgi:hypothetical protein
MVNGWERFVREMKEIERGLVDRVSDVKADDILEKARILKRDKPFQDLIDRQHSLFHGFGLWK